MGSTFTTFPDKFDQQFLGKKKKLPVYIQFVPGIVTDNITGEDSLGGADLNKIGSIRALPHFGDKGIKKKSAMDETYRYWPLLRGIQEVPTPGDPVLLCTMGGVNYYMGPLNSINSPNFNIDTLNTGFNPHNPDTKIKNKGLILKSNIDVDIKDTLLLFKYLKNEM